MATSREARRRPARAGVSVETRWLVDGSGSLYARFTDPRGRRRVTAPPTGGQTWPDWGKAFTAACTAQAEAERLSYRSTDGEKMLFADLVAHHYLPTLSDAAPNTRKNTASHLGDSTGVSTRQGFCAERAVCSQLLQAFGHLPLGVIGRNEVQQWISSGSSQSSAGTAMAARMLQVYEDVLSRNTRMSRPPLSSM